MPTLALAFAFVVAPAAHAKKVLYLGDSLSMGAFGQTFDSAMRDAGHEVYTYVTGGATPYYWLSLYAPMRCTIGHWEKTPEMDRRRKTVTVPKIETLLDRHKPEIVVVQTGVNLYSELRNRRRSGEDNAREVRRLVDNMCRVIANSGAKSYWIAPPHSHTGRFPAELQKQMLELFKSTVEPYGFTFESPKVTRFVDPYPKTDGIHYGPTEARAWAVKVAGHFVPWAGGAVPPPLPVVALKPKIIRLPAGTDASPRGPAAAPEPPPRAEDAGSGTVANALAPAPEPIPGASEEPAASASPPTSGSPAGEPFQVRRPKPADGATPIVTVDIVLKRKSRCPHPSEVTYNRALAIYEWEVVRVEKGSYPHETIRIAHPVFWAGKRGASADFPVGKRWSLELAQLERYPSISRIQTFDDLEVDYTREVYIAKL